MLQIVAQAPTGDPRMIPHLERCLNDRTVTVLSLPYLFGELRWHAAQALAFELEAIGKPRTIVIDDLPEMLNTDAIGALARQHLNGRLLGPPSRSKSADHLRIRSPARYRRPAHLQSRLRALPAHREHYRARKTWKVGSAFQPAQRTNRCAPHANPQRIQRLQKRESD